jgi:teichuronic acid biosynthesis glycosyltransferase TuaG
MPNPLVSVIIPVYNAENFIEQTIQSVLNQTIQDFEIIVLNDGSKDNSGAVIQALQSKTIESFTFQNQIAAFQIQEIKGLKKQKGKYFAFLDADDIWKKDNLEKTGGFRFNK